jgi:hypothetical protein
MLSFIQTTNNKAIPLLNSKQKTMAAEVFNLIKQKNNSADYLGNAAINLWMMGYPEMAFYLMGKTCEQDATDANNLNNYASMLTMMGAAHLAIPVLDNINLKFLRTIPYSITLARHGFNWAICQRRKNILMKLLQFIPCIRRLILPNAWLKKAKEKFQLQL